MQKKIFGAVKVILALGLGVLIIWLSLKDLTAVEKDSIFLSFKRANYWWVIFTMMLGIGSHLLRAIRWKLLLHPMGYNPKLSSSFLAVMVGYFTNLGIPRSGEVFRCSILYKEEGIPVNKSFGTVIIERTIDMMIFGILFLATLFFEFDKIAHYLESKLGTKFEVSFSNSKNLLFLLGAFLVFALILFLSRKIILKSKLGNKVFSFIKGILEGLKSILKVKNPLLFISYSIGIWFLYFLMIYLCFYSLPETQNLSISAGLSVLVLGSVGIMITPGGIGLYPKIVTEALVLYGIGSISGIAMGWLAWSAQTIMIIVVGSASLLIVSIKSKKNEPLSETEK